MLQNTLQFAPAAIVTRHDERGEQACTLLPGFSKASDKPELLLEKKTATLTNFMCAIRRFLWPQNSVIEFVQIFAEDQGTFYLVSEYFTLVATFRMHYRNLESRNTMV